MTDLKTTQNILTLLRFSLENIHKALVCLSQGPYMKGSDFDKPMGNIEKVINKLKPNAKN